MLRELRIKDFAVIENLSLEFGTGLNVLTGETGAGKSIIFSALGLVCGTRAGNDIIRHKADEAVVEALFEVVPQAARARLKEGGFDSDAELIIKRIVSRSGKNRTYVNGSLSPLNLLTEIGASAVHIYGQHEHRSLLEAETHLSLLDAFAGLQASAAGVSEKFKALAVAWQSLVTAKEMVEKRRREKELLEAQAEEIASARLNPDDEEALQARKNILLHSEKLYQGCLQGEELLYEGENALVSRLGRYVTRLRELAGIDEELRGPVELLESALAQLGEATTQLRRYAERVHFEPGALEQVEERLAEVHRLKRKYNGSVEDILRFGERVRAELKALERGEEEIPALEKAFETARQAAWDAAAALSLERQRATKTLKKEMEEELKSLGMPDTVFEARFLDWNDSTDEPPFLIGGKKLTGRGVDQVEFFFSPNPGEPPKPLVKVASGGELSRVMLALKSLVLAPGEVPTLLFDEVDAGIGGGVAEIVGKRLKKVARAHQVICVTHLPQIAALADSHYVVRKEIAKGRTFTRVEKLNEKQRIAEIARMLGGVKITPATVRHAEEMVKGQ